MKDVFMSLRNNRKEYMKTNPIEELYASPEMEEAYERGKKAGLKMHVCPPRNVTKKIIYKNDTSVVLLQRKGWGIVSNGKLLNPTFHTERQATQFIYEQLVPVNPQYRTLINEKTFVIKL